MRYDVEISHQIIVPMYLCIDGYCATLIYSVPPVVQGSYPGGVHPARHPQDETPVPPVGHYMSV